MKKIVSILMCLLCVASASAVTYGNPYRGAGRNGYVGTGYRAAGSESRFVGMSQAPTATMRTTSSAGFSAVYAGTTQEMSGVTIQVQGMYTAASAIRGGVTSVDTYSAMSGARRTPGHNGRPGGCPECHDGNGDGLCDHCGCNLNSLDGCTCEDENGYCWCPIGDGWDVWIMLAVMAISYVLFMRRRVKSE